MAFDPVGNVIIGGYVRNATIWEGQPIGVDGARTPLVLKYDSQGRFLWLVQLLGLDGSVSSIRASALGTVVAAGCFDGETTFGSDFLSHPPSGDGQGRMLLTIEPDGQPRWARQLDEGQLGPILAVEPTGKAAVAFRLPNCNSIKVEYWNLAGEPLWDRTFAPVDCQRSVTIRGIAVSNHDVVLSGLMNGTVDFGTGKISDANGYLLQLSE
jgi:hypothetical protein